MKLTVIGCSHTYYVWTTWADILSQEYDDTTQEYQDVLEVFPFKYVQFLFKKQPVLL